jgi:hypothetical protein
MRLSHTFILMLPVLWACGGGISMVLKSPVESKCGGAGLKGCPELTDGVLLYVEGKEPEGKDKLIKGAAENAPEKVQEFAKQLKLLKDVPGVASHMKKVLEVADILAKAGKDSKGKGGKGGDSPSGTPGSPGAPAIGETNAVAH